MRSAWTLFKRLGPVGPVALISMTLPGVMGILLVIASIRYETAILHFVHGAPVSAIVLYILGFAILAGFPILPTYSVSFLGGYIFKMQLGTGASLAGYVGAAMVSYGFLHLLSGDRVEKLIDEYPRWKAVRDELLARSRWRTLGIIALLRLPPNVPFAVVNLVIVTARIGLGNYFLGTLVGVIPRTLAVVYIAATASRIEEIQGSAKWLTIVGVVATIIALAVITHLAQNAIKRIGRPETVPEDRPHA